MFIIFFIEEKNNYFRILNLNEELNEKVNQRTEELRLINVELSEKNKRMEKELEMARRIQEAFIPKIFPFPEKIKVTGFYMPMHSL